MGSVHFRYLTIHSTIISHHGSSILLLISLESPVYSYEKDFIITIIIPIIAYIIQIDPVPLNLLGPFNSLTLILLIRALISFITVICLLIIITKLILTRFSANLWSKIKQEFIIKLITHRFID